MSGYIGNIPVPQATQTRDVFTATSGQTTFATSGYTPGYLDVWLNGVKLVNGTDFTATNGSDVVLTSGAATDDTVEVLSYSTYEVNNQAFTGDFSVDGTTFKVDAANNRVGIGTGTPDAPFVVSGTNVRQKIMDGSNTLTLGQWDGLTNRIESSGRDMYLIQYGASNTIKFATNATERMNIDASGRVTTPFQPAFHAIRTTHVTASGTIVFESKTFDVGNNYNNTTGIFTAPVAGRYLITFSTLLWNMGSASSAQLQINGSSLGSAFGTYGSFTGDYAGQGAAAVISVNAGDAVSIYYTNAGTNLHSGYTWWSGCLLG